MASNNKFRKSNARFLKAGREAEHDEYGQEHKGVTECQECHNVHFKKTMASFYP